MKKTQNILNELRTMAGAAGEAVFRRVAMIREVLEDREFVGAQFGDWETARDVLFQECFPDLSMACTLDQLLTLYRWFPTVEKWEEYKFNIRRLWAQYTEEEAKGKREQKQNKERAHRSPTKEEHQKAMEDLQAFQVVIKRKDEAIDDKDRRIGDLLVENRNLKNENAELKREAMSLRRKLEKAREPEQEAAVA